MPAPRRKLEFIPEIMYDAPEYPGQKTSPVPYMVIPKDKDAPIGLFVLEYRKTGEYEVGDRGTPEEIEEGPFPHTYIDMDYLVEVLTEQFPDMDIPSAVKTIRVALGMKPTKAESAAAGRAILDRVEAAAKPLLDQAQATQPERLVAIMASRKE